MPATLALNPVSAPPVDLIGLLLSPNPTGSAATTFGTLLNQAIAGNAPATDPAVPLPNVPAEEPDDDATSAALTTNGLAAAGFLLAPLPTAPSPVTPAATAGTPDGPTGAARTNVPAVTDPTREPVSLPASDRAATPAVAATPGPIDPSRRAAVSAASTVDGTAQPRLRPELTDVAAGLRTSPADVPQTTVPPLFADRVETPPAGPQPPTGLAGPAVDVQGKPALQSPATVPQPGGEPTTGPAAFPLPHSDATAATPTTTSPAGALPTVVAQTPIVTDRTLTPAFQPPLGASLGRPPVTEPESVGRVVAGGQTAVSGDAAKTPFPTDRVLDEAIRTAGLPVEPRLSRFADVFERVADTTAESDRPTPTTAADRPLPAPTPAPTQTRVSPLAPEFAEALVSNAAVLRRGDGGHEFRLRLDPAALGEVQVRLVSADGKLTAELVVADDGVRRMIESQLPDLRQRLESAGLPVSSFDVSTQSGGGQRQPDRTDDPDRRPWATPAADLPRPTPPRSRPIPTTGGALDVTA